MILCKNVCFYVYIYGNLIKYLYFPISFLLIISFWNDFFLDLIRFVPQGLFGYAKPLLLKQDLYHKGKFYKKEWWYQLHILLQFYQTYPLGAVLKWRHPILDLFVCLYFCVFKCVFVFVFLFLFVFLCLCFLCEFDYICAELLNKK